METVTVKLGSRSYRILIHNGILSRSGSLAADLAVAKTAVIITNTTVAPLYLQTVRRSFEQSSFSVHDIILPDGEQYKQLSTLDSIYRKLLEIGLDRSSALIALGGGVVGDITGFAASTFLRGVPFIQIPTTLLSQVDSSVGGKTGINLEGGKNMAGTFYQPSIVIIDPDVLQTLDRQEFRSGMAEVIKYGIISDRDFFSFLHQHMQEALHLEPAALVRILQTCCCIKADITSADEREHGIRSFLNFGHTLGHAVETLTQYRSYSHGQAVAIGMAAAARISHDRGFCSREDAETVLSLLKQAGLPTDIPDRPADEYVDVMKKDKKHTGSLIRMVLMKNIGEVFLEDMAPETLRSCLKRALNLR